MTTTTREALQNLIGAIEFTPLGTRAIVAMNEAKAALAAADAEDAKPATIVKSCFTIAKPAPGRKICEVWGVWRDGSDGGSSGWIGSNGIPDLFASQEKTEIVRPTSVYQPRLINMYAALPAPVDAQIDRDALFDTWLSVGADFKGLSWNDFMGKYDAFLAANAEKPAGTFIDEGSRQPNKCEWPTCACALNPKDCANAEQPAKSE